MRDAAVIGKQIDGVRTGRRAARQSSPSGIRERLADLLNRAPKRAFRPRCAVRWGEWNNARPSNGRGDRALLRAGDTIFSSASPVWLDHVFGASRGVRRLEGSKLFWPEERPEVLADEARRRWRAQAIERSGGDR
jgi:hypothetical protein